MKRTNHKIKNEYVEPSTSNAKEEHDLAYYIHDRVELMHQVFSIIKTKELKAMAPECVRKLTIDDLQELCLGELLGISSKRLCAVLDGAEPPSDTESSSQSPEHLETISLDSISSDDEILSETSKKSKKKIRHRRNSKHKRKKSKGHKDKSKTPAADDDAEKSTASRAGLTVLELLELQARARAIRAQLQKEQVTKKTSETMMVESNHTTDDEVEIKEEAAEVVEISSEDEKPNIKELDNQNDVRKNSVINSDKNKDTEKESTENMTENAHSITKITNDLVITVPQAKPTRKIKLNRNKVIVSVPNMPEENSNKNATKNLGSVSNVVSKAIVNKVQNVDEKKLKTKEKSKKKTKRKSKSSNVKEGSDHDEITLQLSDTEKMDLLEDLDRKNFEEVSSSCSEDSDSSSSDSDNESSKADVHNREKNKDATNSEDIKTKTNGNVNTHIAPILDLIKQDNHVILSDVISDKQNNDKIHTIEISKDLETNIDEVRTEITHENAENIKSLVETITTNQNDEEISGIADKPIVENNISHDAQEVALNKNVDIQIFEDPLVSSSKITDTETKEMSEGEISDQESSEIEAVDVQPEVVCISDEENSKKEKKKKNKKAKKNKKKDKKSKPKSDFQEGNDENFFKDQINPEILNVEKTEAPIVTDDNDVYEILELSDDSSCYEVEGVSVLSKEPTADEIAALSAKIDEIERVEVITEKQIQEHEKQEAEKERSQAEEEIENISWKDRYLGSKKVKRVLTTSNIMNAIRKKNKELKKKLEESKKIEVIESERQEKPTVINLEEGSIEHYNTLQGSTTYVDPVADTILEVNGNTMKESAEAESAVSKEMKKDAKQLLKMYKRLLKYNDMNKQKNPNKKKKKHKKKEKEANTAKNTNG